jgi:uncharacterized coiled-coil protein SlyX
MEKPKQPQDRSNRRVLDRIRELDKAWGNAHDNMRTRLDMLEKLAEGQTKVLERLAEKLAEMQTSGGMSDRKLDAMQALGKVLESLASAQANTQKQTAQLLDTLLEKAGKQVLSGLAHEWGKKGAERKKEKAAANVSRETSGPDFVKSCEECRALLDGRQPAHTDDMMAHAVGNHLAQLRQQGLIAVA